MARFFTLPGVLLQGQSKIPEGFEYTPDFITEQEENDLLKFIYTLNLKTFVFQGFEAKRRVKSFGYDYHFDARSLQKGLQIPEIFMPLIHKVAQHLQIQPTEFKEVLVTEYPPGSVINWHRDAPPFSIIAGISLLSGCRFRLRPLEKENQSRQNILNVPVGRRSLYVLRDQARENWQHSIAPVNQQRYSITLRTLK